MSLIPKHSLTDKEIAARQRNGAKSRGAATAEGKERVRAAHLRHGFYAEGRDDALRALGEDPAELAALIASAHEDWRPTTEFQAGVVEHLARLAWRMQRAERIQLSLAAEQMLQHQKRRADLTLHLRYKRNDAVGPLLLLTEYPTDPRFYTPSSHFADFQKACGPSLDEGQKAILELMHRLRKPAAWEEDEEDEDPGDERAREQSGKTAAGGRCSPDGTGDACPPPGTVDGAEVPPGLGEEEDEYLNFLELLDDDDSPLPYPDIPVAEGAERDELRLELVKRATQELNELNEVWDEQIAQFERPLTSIEMDGLQATPHRHAELMRREEESCFRKFVRLGNFMIKFQNHVEKRAQNEGLTGEVIENTGSEETAPATNCPEHPPARATECPPPVPAGSVPVAAGPAAVAVQPAPVAAVPASVAVGPASVARSAAVTARTAIVSPAPVRVTSVPPAASAPSANAAREPVAPRAATEAPQFTSVGAA